MADKRVRISLVHAKELFGHANLEWISAALNRYRVVAGLVPTTPNFKARSKSNRGGRDKPGHDPERGQVLKPDRNPV